MNDIFSIDMNLAKKRKSVLYKFFPERLKHFRENQDRAAEDNYQNNWLFGLEGKEVQQYV